MSSAIPRAQRAPPATAPLLSAGGGLEVRRGLAGPRNKCWPTARPLNIVDRLYLIAVPVPSRPVEATFLTICGWAVFVASAAAALLAWANAEATVTIPYTSELLGRVRALDQTQQRIDPWMVVLGLGTLLHGLLVLAGCLALARITTQVSRHSGVSERTAPLA